MKQMTLIEMNGFLKGACIPSDLNVNETNAEYLVRKFSGLESKLETALLECRSAGITIDNLEAKCAALAAENAGLKTAITAVNKTSEECELNGDELKYVVEPYEFNALTDLLDETPATDAFLAEVRAQGVEMAACALDDVNQFNYAKMLDDLAQKILQEAAQ